MNHIIFNTKENTMRKFMTVLLALAMVISTMTMLVTPASAIVEGDWVTSRAADDYGDEESYRPASGYKYEMDKGLLTISADYTNNTPYTHIHTKKTYNLKEANADGNGNAVSLEFTVLDFAYGGESGSKDHWVSFSLHSQEIYAPGKTGYGEGVSVLIRGAGNGSAIAQFFHLSDSHGWTLFSEYAIQVPMNAEQQEVYTFETKYDEWGYTFNVCGQEIIDETGIADEVLNQYCADGAYVGMSFYSGETGTPIEICVNKFQGEVPYGEDSAEPEDNMNHFAPIADSSTVEAGKPALIWDAKKEQFNRFNATNIDFEENEDGTLKLTNKSAGTYFMFTPKSAISYEAADFPVIVILTRDCYAEYGTFYYSSGDVVGAQPDCSCDFDIAEVDYGEGWALGILDLTGDLDWTGRINMIRCDFINIDYTDEDMKVFDVAYLAAFRTVEEAKAYTDAYLVDLLGKLPETQPPKTEEPTTENPEADPDQNTSDNDSEQQTEQENTGRCQSLVAAPAVALVLVLGVAFVGKKKD